MVLRGPPIQCPEPQVRTGDASNSNNIDSGSPFSASDDTTLAGSLPPSPRQPPAYGAEGAPPKYQEADDPDGERARRKIRRTLCIRLLTSIFITVLVCLIIAAVVARIHDSNINTDWSSNETTSIKTNGTSFTIKVVKDATLIPSTTAATKTALQGAETGLPGFKTQSPVTISTPTTTAEDNAKSTVDCPSLGVFVGVTLVTTISPAPTQRISTTRKRKIHQLVDEDEQMLGVTVYTVNGCVLSRTLYKTSDSGSEYRCTMTCPNKRWESNQVRHVVADEWGACG